MLIVAEYKLGDTLVKIADDYLPKSEEEYKKVKERIDATATRIWKEVCNNA